MISTLYHRWHNHPRHPFWHWVVFSFVAIFVFNHLSIRIGDHLNEEVLSLSIQTPQAQAAGNNRYASPAGSGSACTNRATPCTVSTGLGQMIPGDTLWLLDGTYTGASGMIRPTVSGTANARITIRAENEGNATIDGGGVNEPISVYDVSYNTIIGVNAKNSSGHVVLVGRTNVGDSFNEFKKIVAWDAGNANSHVYQTVRSNRNLFEDTAGFGRGRYIYIDYQSNNNTFRRAWGRWMCANGNWGPKATFVTSYGSAGGIFENVIGEWDKQSCNTDTGQFEGIFSPIGLSNDDHNVKVFGSIGLLLSKWNTSNLQNVFYWSMGGTNASNHLIQDSIGYIERGSSQKPFNLNVGTGTGMRITNWSSIYGAGGAPSLTTGWASTNKREGAFLSDVYSGSNTLYANNGASGATIGYRYENGVLTSTPLWPWPMTARIKAALNTTSYTNAQNYDLDSEIQAIFGNYPSGSIPTLTPTPTTSPTPTFSKCDQNHDNLTNVLDLQSLANVILGKTSCSYTCDLNQDSQVNVLDLQYLANVILGRSGCI